MSLCTDPAAIGEQLDRYLRTHLVAADLAFGPDTPFTELGVDSFGLVELLLFTEDAFGVQVPDAAMTHENLTSLASLARCIAGLAGSAQTAL